MRSIFMLAAALFLLAGCTSPPPISGARPRDLTPAQKAEVSQWAREWADTHPAP